MDLQKFTLGLLTGLGIITVLMVGKPLLIPIVIAFLIWMLIDSVSSKLKGIRVFNKKVPKWFISALTISLFAVLMMFFYNTIVIQTNKLVEAAPFYHDKANLLITKLSAVTGYQFDEVMTELYASLDMTELVSIVAGSTQSFLSSLFLVAIYVGFMFVEQANINKKVDALLQVSNRFALFQSVFKNSIAMIKRYLRLKSFVSALTSVLCYLVLVAFQVDFAELWAIATFLLNFIPNIGSALAVIFPSILISLQFDSLTYIFIVIGCLMSIQFLVGNVLEPAVMGKSLNLSAFMILISLSFWGYVWGLLGMFLAIPMMVATAILFSHIDETKWLAILMSADGQLLSE